jgi:hypothetical protein
MNEPNVIDLRDLTFDGGYTLICEASDFETKFDVDPRAYGIMIQGTRERKLFKHFENERDREGELIAEVYRCGDWWLKVLND